MCAANSHVRFVGFDAREWTDGFRPIADVSAMQLKEARDHGSKTIKTIRIF
jgi:hypothetical protein